MKARTVIRFFVCCAVCLAVGATGSIITSPAEASAWYEGLRKPVFTPPSWVFGPVWTGLYILMGVAVFWVWQKGLAAAEVKIAIVVFAVQLILNALWSPLFFGLKNPHAAFADVTLLWAAILATILFFYRVSKVSAILLIPYMLWVSFASFLNYSIMMLN